MLHRSVEFFLLEDTEKRLRQRSARQAELIVEHKKAAERRLRFVPAFATPDATIVSVGLLSEALALLLRASAADRSEDLDTLDLTSELTRVCEAGHSAPREWRRLLPLLGARKPLELDHTPIIELREVGHVLRETTLWLRGETDIRSVDNIRWLRRGRFAAVALVIAIALGVKLHDAFATPNVALGKSVSMSSLAFGSPQGAALVDGVESGRHPPSSKKADFVVTNHESRPFALIDLGRNYAIERIVVFNREDDGFDDGLPYTVEISSDGATFTPLDVRSTHFGSGILDPPWSIDARKQHARFVRVRCNQYLALSEIEVFGK
jgi:hypothetical protein